MDVPTTPTFGRVNQTMSKGFRGFSDPMPPLIVDVGSISVTVTLLSATEVQADCWGEVLSSAYEFDWGNAEKKSLAGLRLLLTNAIEKAVESIKTNIADYEACRSKSLKDIRFSFSSDNERFHKTEWHQLYTDFEVVSPTFKLDPPLNAETLSHIQKSIADREKVLEKSNHHLQLAIKADIPDQTIVNAAIAVETGAKDLLLHIMGNTPIPSKPKTYKNRKDIEYLFDQLNEYTQTPFPFIGSLIELADARNDIVHSPGKVNFTGESARQHLLSSECAFHFFLTLINPSNPNYHKLYSDRVRERFKIEIGPD